MEHIFFELQLCIAILIFKEKSNFGYTDHPEISTGLWASLQVMHAVRRLGTMCLTVTCVSVPAALMPCQRQLSAMGTRPGRKDRIDAFCNQ